MYCMGSKLSRDGVWMVLMPPWSGEKFYGRLEFLGEVMTLLSMSPEYHDGDRHTSWFHDWLAGGKHNILMDNG